MVRRSIWVLLLALAACAACSTAIRPGPRPAVPRFSEATAQAGLDYRGSGKCVAFGDLNADGFLDLYSSVVYGADRCFTNCGDGTFAEASSLLQIDPGSDGHGAVVADFDNDGYADLFVAANPESGSDPARQRNRLYMGPDLHNAAPAAGVEGEFLLPAGRTNGPPMNRSCGVALGDYDHDGDLDLYLTRGAYEAGYPNALYRNDSAPGQPQFTDVAASAGVADAGAGQSGGSYACAFADFDGDDFADLFVGNLDLRGTAAGLRLFRNRGDGTFADVSETSGVRGHGFCTACAVGDIDNDGDLDLLAVFGDGKRPAALFINDGGFVFRDRAAAAGLGAVLPGARGGCLGDVNHDGWLDILVATFDGGALFVNRGAGTFAECAVAAGIRNPGMHGCALGDLDSDGDLDLYSSNWLMRQLPETGRFLLHRNERNDRNWLKVTVGGTDSNRSAIGARISVYDAGHAGDPARLRGFREVTAGSGVFSSPPLVQHFGLDARRTYDIVVRFPRTARQALLRGVKPGQSLTITEPAS